MAEWTAGQCLRAITEPRYVVCEGFLPDYMNYGDTAPLRQAVLFPRSAATTNGAQRKLAGLLLQLTNDCVWALRVPRYIAVSKSELFKLARQLMQEDLSRPASRGAYFAERLHRTLDYPIEVMRSPTFHGDDEPLWKIRNTAIEWVVGSTGRISTEQLANDVGDYEVTATRTLNAALSVFVNGLDQEALRNAHAENGVSLIRYNWSIAAGANCLVRRNRRQIATLFPMIAPMVCQEYGAAPSEFQALATAVDRGEPFVDAAAALLCVTKSAIRAIAHVDSRVTGGYWSNRVHVLVRILNMLAPERRPKSDEDWYRLTSACRTISEGLGRPLTSTLVLCLIENLARSGFDSLSQRFDECRGKEAVFAAEDFLSALGDALRWEVSKIAVNRMVPVESPGRIVNRLLSAIWSPRRFFEMATRWRAEYFRIRARMETARIASDQSWPPILIEPFEHDNLRIVELSSVARLREEGKRLSHCAASYGPQCRAGGAHMFSVRNASGISLSTSEIRISRDGKCWKPIMVQHKSMHNGHPSPECSEAVHAFLAKLGSEPMLSRVAALYPAFRLSGSRGRMEEPDHVLASVEAFRIALVGKWSYERLVADVLAEIPESDSVSHLA